MKKTNYSGFGGWIKYVRDYKSNKENLEIIENESIEANRQVKKLGKKLNNEVINKTLLEQEKDNLIALLHKRIDVLSNEFTKMKKRNNELRNTIAILYKQNEDLEIRAEKVELLRRKTAGQVGGLKATITKYEKKIYKLEQESERANQKIHWLKTNQKAPTKEEIIAYEKCMKEVEKRQKNGRSNNNI